jgi:hypothetical protein
MAADGQGPLQNRPHSLRQWLVGHCGINPGDTILHLVRGWSNAAVADMDRKMLSDRQQLAITTEQAVIEMKPLFIIGQDFGRGPK